MHFFVLNLMAVYNPSPEPPEEDDLSGLGHNVGSNKCCRIGSWNVDHNIEDDLQRSQ